jgi:hypothetical protein
MMNPGLGGTDLSRLQSAPLPVKKNNNESYHDEDDGSGDESGSGDGRGGKNKRRSKNDVDGRDFKCKYCDKTYLSYPALYTHMKQKHSKGPDGEMRTPPTSGRGRGRPRKNVSNFQIHTLFLQPYQRTDPKSEEYFHAAERKGGPTDPLTHFDSIIEALFQPSKPGSDRPYKSIQEYPMYQYLALFSANP